jgi:hypothetical protein
MIFSRRALWAAFGFLLLGKFHTATAEEPTSKYIRQSGADTVIVFVHGILGDGVSTWTNTKTNSYWPVMLEQDHTFDGIDIFVYSYHTKLFFETFSIDELAETMR